MTKGTESLLPARVVGFTEPDEPRFSCLVWPIPPGGWAWCIYSGDGSAPGSAQRGSGAQTLAAALDEAAEWARKFPDNPEPWACSCPPTKGDSLLGTWVLTLASVEPGNTATFELRDRGLGETEPSVRRDDATISFRYGDGKEVIYSLAHLLSAHYEPASEGDRG